jgi:GT2 family glycosyltransferase
VVDDAWSYDTYKIQRRFVDTDFEIIRLPENVGGAAAINHAFTRLEPSAGLSTFYDRLPALKAR